MLRRLPEHNKLRNSKGRFRPDLDIRAKVMELHQIHSSRPCSHKRSCVHHIALEVDRSPNSIYELLQRMGLSPPKKD